MNNVPMYWGWSDALRELRLSKQNSWLLFQATHPSGEGA